MPTFSFDIVSEYDKAEVGNAVEQAQREIANRYDFKGTSAALNWLGSDKAGVKLTGDNEYHLDAITDLLRKKLAGRGLSQKVLDTSRERVAANLKITQEITFRRGLDGEKTKHIAKLVRETHPKAKTQVQGEAVRVTSQSKDELQAIMTGIRQADLDYPLNFTNYR